MIEGHAWSDWLEVGDPELDNDHHLQMRLLSSLLDAIEEGRPWLAHRLVQHLRSGSAIHFEEEERRMRDSSDPERAAHQREHDELLARMDELVRAVEDEEDALATAAGIDLRSMLAGHIAGWDRRLAARGRAAEAAEPVSADSRIGEEPLIPAS